MEIVRYAIPTPIGYMEISGSLLGIRSLHLCDLDRATLVEMSNPCITALLEDHPVAACARQLVEYFAGARTDFDLKLDWGGAPEFYRLVWAELLKIPFGSTTTYSAIAEALDNPNAVRAVGMANRSNPIAIVVPCHRVIGKAGELRGYFYGLDTKMLLLRHENPARFAAQGSLF